MACLDPMIHSVCTLSYKGKMSQGQTRGNNNQDARYLQKIRQVLRAVGIKSNSSIPFQFITQVKLITITDLT